MMALTAGQSSQHGLPGCLRRQEDLDLQRFILVVRIMNANSGRFLDRQVIIGIRGGIPYCEIELISASE
jgi:hypothetical protein